MKKAVGSERPWLDTIAASVAKPSPADLLSPCWPHPCAAAAESDSPIHVLFHRAACRNRAPFQLGCMVCCDDSSIWCFADTVLQGGTTRESSGAQGAACLPGRRGGRRALTGASAQEEIESGAACHLRSSKVGSTLCVFTHARSDQLLLKLLQKLRGCPPG